MTDAPADPRHAIRRLNMIGGAVVLLLFGGVGGWAYTSQLSGAVVAPGSVVVESNVKKVQHPTGGVVGDLYVEEGSTVEAGEILLRLDDTIPRTTLGIVRSGLDSELLRLARLIAERDGKSAIEWPEELASRRSDVAMASAFEGEERLFEARRTMQTGQRAQLREQIGQLGEQIRALVAQRKAKKKELDLVARDLESIAGLYERKLVGMERLTTLQREQAKLRGETGQLAAEIARVRGKISETELQVLQLDRDFQTEVLDELREAEAQIAELREREIAARDQLRRTDILAPQAGTVHGLSVFTAGAVIEPGEAIMSIVPRSDRLVIDLQVKPRDIDRIKPGSPATVRLLSANQRTTPIFDTEVTRISADLTREPNSERAYYVARVALDLGSTDRAGLDLRSGMPVEGYIKTGQRTALEYLLEPLSDQIAHAFRER